MGAVASKTNKQTNTGKGHARVLPMANVNNEKRILYLHRWDRRPGRDSSTAMVRRCPSAGT